MRWGETGTSLLPLLDLWVGFRGGEEAGKGEDETEEGKGERKRRMQWGRRLSNGGEWEQS